eukprot:736230-Prorocentrum_lima.AAC.1
MLTLVVAGLKRLASFPPAARWGKLLRIPAQAIVEAPADTPAEGHMWIWRQTYWRCVVCHRIKHHWRSKVDQQPCGALIGSMLKA